MSETYKATGRIVNIFKEAASHPTDSYSKLLHAMEFAVKNRTSGYIVKFDKDGPFNYMAAFVPLELAKQVVELENKKVICEWTTDDSWGSRHSRVVSMQPVEAVVPVAAVS